MTLLVKVKLGQAASSTPLPKSPPAWFPRI